MAIPAGTFTTGRAVGNREDLQDKIYLMADTETPCMAAAGQSEATAVNHEWQTDTLRAQNLSNAALEGDDATAGTRAPTQRVGNICQIFQETLSVSATQEAVKKAGRSSEMAYEKAKAGKALLIDMEGVLFGAQGQNAGTYDGNGVNTVARKARGFESWIASNVSRGSGGANAASATAAPTDGTQRAYTEALLQTVLRSIRTNGGKVGGLKVVHGVFPRSVASTFTGRSSSREIIAANRVQATVQFFASDYGVVEFLDTPHIRQRSVLVINPEMVSVGYLRRMMTRDLAVTGDSLRKQMVCEATLVVKNEKAHGVVADVSTS